MPLLPFFSVGASVGSTRTVDFESGKTPAIKEQDEPVITIEFGFEAGIGLKKPKVEVTGKKKLSGPSGSVPAALCKTHFVQAFEPHEE